MYIKYIYEVRKQLSFIYLILKSYYGILQQQQKILNSKPFFMCTTFRFFHTILSSMSMIFRMNNLKKKHISLSLD